MYKQKVDSLYDWFNSNKLSLNVNKTNYMLSTNNIETQLALGNLKIQIGNQVKEIRKIPGHHNR